MLLQAAINGGRTRPEHPAVPITPEEQAAEAAAAVRAGARAIHVHARGPDGRESLDPDAVAQTVEAVRASCPGIPLGVSTGAWIVGGTERRRRLVAAWDVLPDFASVNLHEPGALDLIALLLDRGVGVEAGLWHAGAARAFQASGLASRCLRVLLEPAEEGGAPMTILTQIETVLEGTPGRRLLHGLDASAWALLEVAAARGYEARIGFEDTLCLPDGGLAADNAALVGAARRILAAHGAR